MGSVFPYALTRFQESGVGKSVEPVNSLRWSTDIAFLLPAISVSWVLIMPEFWIPTAIHAFNCPL